MRRINMKIGTARDAAVEWVTRNASRQAWFRGAYFSGSTIGMSADAELPAASDIDIVVVTTEAEPPVKLGKFLYRGTLLEVTYLPWKLYASAENVLSSYHLAGSFRLNTIIADPTGHFAGLQAKVSRLF